MEIGFVKGFLEGGGCRRESLERHDAVLGAARDITNVFGTRRGEFFSLKLLVYLRDGR